MVDVVDESLTSIRTEWKVLKQKWFIGETLDPVYEGMVKDFCTYDVTMTDIYEKVELFMKGVDNLSERLIGLSESVTSGLAHTDDPLIISDSCKFKEAINQISRPDAPHSAISKVRRDMDFNIMNPVRLHLINNRSLKANLDKRRRKLLELNTAKKQVDDLGKKNVSKTDKKYLTSQAVLDAAKMAFQEVDRHVFEWLYILEEYRGDILDSTLQTLKYLQYEFFATSAHAVSGVLPVRMEFRPMVEMTPDHLSAQVDMELQEADEEAGEGDEPITDFSRRLIEKMSKDNKAKPGDGLDSSAGDSGPALPVDPLSLSSLLSQGFEEGPARRALRLHHNNTQAALDWLVDGGADGADNPANKSIAEDGVRMPKTIKRIQKLKTVRRAQLEKLKRLEAAEADHNYENARSEPPSNSVDSTAGAKLVQPAEKLEKPANPPPMMDLLDFDEPPPPTDFSKQVNVLELPSMLSFENEASQAKAASSEAAIVMQPLAQGSSLQAEQAPAKPVDANAAMLLLQSAQITPEQLLQAAQQLMAAQQGTQVPGQTSHNGQVAPVPGSFALAAGGGVSGSLTVGEQATPTSLSSPLDGLFDFKGV